MRCLPALQKKRAVPCHKCLKVGRRWSDLDVAWGMAFRVRESLAMKELLELLVVCLPFKKSCLSWGILEYTLSSEEMCADAQGTADCLEVLMTRRVDNVEIWVVWLSAEMWTTEVVFRLGNDVSSLLTPLVYDWKLNHKKPSEHLLCMKREEFGIEEYW